MDEITCLAELCDIWEGMEDVGKRGRLLSAKSNVACIVLSSFWPSAVPSGLMFNPETLAQPALGSYLTYCKLLSFLSKWSQTRQRQFFPASIFLPLSHISEMGGNIPLLSSFSIPPSLSPPFLPFFPAYISFLVFISPLPPLSLNTLPSSFPDSIHPSLTSNLWPFSLSFLSAGIVDACTMPS